MIESVRIPDRHQNAARTRVRLLDRQVHGRQRFGAVGLEIDRACGLGAPRRRHERHERTQKRERRE
jgi:hypothetical protein